MSNWSCVAGGALLVPSGPQGHHLHIIIFGPANFPGYPKQSCISVSICTIRTGLPFDNTRIVNPGEHEFIKHPSYVAYRHARIDTSAHFEEMVKNGYFYPQTTVVEPLLREIYSGLHESSQTPNYLKQLAV